MTTSTPKATPDPEPAPDPTPASLFGEILRRRRKRVGWSHETLAEYADCHPTTISLLERGKRNPSLVMMLKLTQALDCPAWKLLQEVERKL